MRISDWSSDVCSSDLPAELQAPGRLLSTIAPGCASRVRFAHVLRPRPSRPGAALAGAPGPVLAADPRRPPDRLAAAAVAALVGAVARRRGRAPGGEAGGVPPGAAAVAFGRRRDSRLRSPRARTARRAHDAQAAHRRR